MNRLLVGLIFSTAAFAQTEWRSAIDDVLSQPPTTVGAQDIQRLEESLRFGARYLTARDPSDPEANRDLIRRISSYLAQVNLENRNPRTRFALRRANQALASIRTGLYSAQPDPPPPPPAPAQKPPAFDPHAPVIENVADADAAMVRELRTRYESAAVQAIGAWQAADSLRAGLLARGMALNPQMPASALRVQLYLETAADALRGREWEDARDNLTRAEYETQRLLKMMGR